MTERANVTGKQRLIFSEPAINSNGYRNSKELNGLNNQRMIE